MQIILLSKYQKELLEYWRTQKLTNDQSLLILEEIGRLNHHITEHERKADIEGGHKIKMFYKRKGVKIYTRSFKNIINCVEAFNLDYHKFYKAILRSRKRGKESFYMITPYGQRAFEINFDLF